MNNKETGGFDKPNAHPRNIKTYEDYKKFIDKPSTSIPMDSKGNVIIKPGTPHAKRTREQLEQWRELKEEKDRFPTTSRWSGIIK